jgi:hypothetical protein
LLTMLSFRNVASAILKWAWDFGITSIWVDVPIDFQGTTANHSKKNFYRRLSIQSAKAIWYYWLRNHR